MKLSQDITIIIPTLNRSDKLNKTLLYLASLNWRGTIVIGDSSNEFHALRNKASIDLFKNNISIEYEYLNRTDYPNAGTCQQRLSQICSTKYCVYSGDDDYLQPSVLEEAAQFLETHPGYVACGGGRYNFTLNEEGNQIINVTHVNYPESSDESHFARWKQYSRVGLSSQYFLHRSEVWKKSLELVDRIYDPYLGQEYLPCSLSHLMGKHHVLDRRIVLFEYNRNQNFSFIQNPYWGFLHDDRWPHSLRTVEEQIISTIRSQNEEVDSSIIAREIQRHILSIFNHQFKNNVRTYVENQNLVNIFTSHAETSEELQLFLLIIENKL
jgi:glycosyltransferase domain-containing protein